MIRVAAFAHVFCLVNQNFSQLVSLGCLAVANPYFLVDQSASLLTSIGKYGESVLLECLAMKCRLMLATYRYFAMLMGFAGFAMPVATDHYLMKLMR